jgi:hypothetical protein
MTESHARLLIRISPDLKEKLIELAKREHRSLNRQIEFLLDAGVRGVAVGQSSLKADPIVTRKQRK